VINSSKDTSAATGNDGAQAIRRAASILRQIAKDPQTGSTLREISEAMDLSRSTTHRILKCLVGEKLVAQSADARRYTIGELAAELGLAVHTHQDAILSWRSAVEEVARETGATTYLMCRSGNETVCLDKADGTSVMRYIPQEVGQRRPLGLGGGGVALLAALPEPERERTILAVERHLQGYQSVEALRASLTEARRTGFGESRGVVMKDGYGLGIALPSATISHLAISIATHESLATEDNVRRWKRMLKGVVSTS